MNAVPHVHRIGVARSPLRLAVSYGDTKVERFFRKGRDSTLRAAIRQVIERHDRGTQEAARKEAKAKARKEARRNQGRTVIDEANELLRDERYSWWSEKRGVWGSDLLAEKERVG